MLARTVAFINSVRIGPAEKTSVVIGDASGVEAIEKRADLVHLTLKGGDAIVVPLSNVRHMVPLEPPKRPVAVKPTRAS